MGRNVSYLDPNRVFATSFQWTHPSVIEGYC